MTPTKTKAIITYIAIFMMVQKYGEQNLLLSTYEVLVANVVIIMISYFTEYSLLL